VHWRQESLIVFGNQPICCLSIAVMCNPGYKLVLPQRLVYSAITC
jgi:hypothetical protein